MIWLIEALTMAFCGAMLVACGLEVQQTYQQRRWFSMGAGALTGLGWFYVTSALFQVAVGSSLL